MGVAKLEISSNIQALMDKIDSLTAGFNKLSSNTEEYTQRSTAGFNKAAQSASQLKTEIKEQEKIIKDMTREAEKLAKSQSKHTDEQAKAYKRLQGDIKVATQELKGMKAQQEQVAASAGKGSELFKKLGTTIAAAFTVGAVINFVKKSAEAWMMQEKAEAKLRTALGGRVSVQQELIQQSKELMKTTLFRDEEIVNAQAMLGTMIKDGETIKKLTPLVLDLAAAKGIDLASAAQRVGKAVVGSTMELGKMGMTITGTKGSAERLTSVIDNLTTSVGGQSTGQNVGLTGAVNTFSDSWAEMLESFGALEQSGQGVMPFLSSLLDMIARLNTDIAKLDFGNFWRGVQAQIWGDDLKTVSAQLEKFDEGLIAGSNEIDRRFKMGVKPLKELQEELIKAADENIKFAESLEGDNPSVAAFWRAYKKAVIEYSEEVKKLKEDEEEAAKKKKEEEDARRKAWDEEQKRIRERMALEQLLSETRAQGILDIGEMMKAEDEAAEAEQKRLEKQQEFVDQQLAALAELTAAYRDEAEVDDIPFDTKKIKKEIEDFQKFSEDHPLFAKLGIESEEQLEQIKEYVGQLTDFANEIIDQQVKASERIVEDQNQRIDEQQALVDNELELKAEGLANSYELEKENLKKMQKARDEAIKDRERMIKIQRIMSTTESGIALVSAAANIIKGFSSIPVVGVVLGLAAVGAMIAGFILATSKAKDAVKMERGGLLEGKRHTQGGIPMEAEDGEFFVNRNSTKKHLPLLEAINRDDREGMRLYFDRKFINKFHTERNERDYTKHLKNIERNTRNKNSETIYGNGFIIERIGGYTKKINLN